MLGMWMALQEPAGMYIVHLWFLDFDQTSNYCVWSRSAALTLGLGALPLTSTMVAYTEPPYTHKPAALASSHLTCIVPSMYTVYLLLAPQQNVQADREDSEEYFSAPRMLANCCARSGKQCWESKDFSQARRNKYVGRCSSKCRCP